MWAPWWSRWAQRPSAPSIRSTRSWRLRERYGFRVHVDAAYGGYFRLIPEALDEPARRAYAAIEPGRLHRRRSRTSTACSPMAAAACSFAIRRWAASTSTTRPIPTSLQRSCIWARSAWSARAPAPQPWLCGPRSSFCRFSLAASLPAAWSQGRAAALELDQRLRHDDAFQPLAAGAPELDIVVWKREGGDFDDCIAVGAGHFFGLCNAKFAPRPCTIAAILVRAAGKALSLESRRACDLPALGADEARARGLAGQHLGKADRSLRGSGEGVERWPNIVLPCLTKENVLIQAGECFVTIFPQLGGKIASIRVKDRELLQAPLAPLARAPDPCHSTPAMPVDGTSACLQVAACTVETAAGPAEIPDHGDLWREWTTGIRVRVRQTSQRSGHLDRTVFLSAAST